MYNYCNFTCKKKSIINHCYRTVFFTKIFDHFMIIILRVSDVKFPPIYIYIYNLYVEYRLN